jgi:hypothetical protein
MKRIFLILIIAGLAACSKPPETLPVTLQATGTGLFEVGYYFHTWNKTFTQDSFKTTLEAQAGDTVILAAYGNDCPVIISVNDTSLEIAPHDYRTINLIIE